MSAEVSIKGGLPNATYSVGLVQIPSGVNCEQDDVSLTTNGQGNGNVHVSDAILAGSTGAFDFLASPAVTF